MKIAESTVAMYAESQKTSLSVTSVVAKQATNEASKTNGNAIGEQLRQQAGANSFAVGEISNPLLDSLDISNEGRVADLRSKYSQQNVDFKVLLLRKMIEMLNGQKGKAISRAMQDLQDRLSELETNIGSGFSQTPLARGGVSLSGRGGAVTFERVTETYQSQSVSFDMAASVKTADGKTIDIGISFNMSSEMYSRTSEQLENVRLCDPLVVNFDGPAAALESTKFSFDLDQDGKEDQISHLAKGSGFLALDKNGDGKINDGGELFGTKSGDGFKDLAVYDGDGNGWIDENDDIFNKLRIWTKNEDGTDKLVSLGQAGIGAIYLGNVKTNFEYGDGTQTNGVMRSTGFYLNENGGGGTIQHIDMAV